MESAAPKRVCKGEIAGFTFVEVIVSLIIGTLIVGGVMGLASTSLNYTQRIRMKTEDWPTLEAAAMELLADPGKAEDGPLVLDRLPGSPTVDVRLTRVVDEDDGGELENSHGDLYRVELAYRAQMLELSILIPASEDLLD